MNIISIFFLIFLKDNSLENIIETKELAKEYIDKCKNIDRKLILRLVDRST